jgi:aspartyl-tRNA(Asn)/glutamyl-tRNA(Gln) amidotransferase subunit A
MKQAGGQLVGKTTMDEFGFGTFSTNSAHGVPLNPFDKERSCGGSSGGAGAAACLIPGHVALGVSTGGSISGPASFCGVVGLTPTYGRVSRYGLIDYGNSLDKVGLLARSASLVAKHFRTIAGPDPKDPTSCAQPSLPGKGNTPGSLAVPIEALQNLSPAVSRSFQEALSKFKDLGVEVHEVSMPSLRFSLPAYYILATSEASTNLARYCGMRFGRREEELNQHFNDFFTGVRSESFGDEAKRRILLGTFCRMVAGGSPVADRGIPQGVQGPRCCGHPHHALRLPALRGDRPDEAAGDVRCGRSDGPPEPYRYATYLSSLRLR